MIMSIPEIIKTRKQIERYAKKTKENKGIPKKIKDIALLELDLRHKFYSYKELYPTHKKVIDNIFDYHPIYIYKNDCILDPCAGFGNFLDYFNQFTSNINSIEINKDLIPLLEKKGYNALNEDFLKVDNQVLKDRFKNIDTILLNPPFTLAYEFIYKSYDLLKMCKGGMLYVIVPCGIFKDKEFKKWFDSNHDNMSYDLDEKINKVALKFLAIYV